MRKPDGIGERKGEDGGVSVRGEREARVLLGLLFWGQQEKGRTDIFPPYWDGGRSFCVFGFSHCKNRNLAARSFPSKREFPVGRRSGRLCSWMHYEQPPMAVDKSVQLNRFYPVSEPNHPTNRFKN